MGGNFLLNPDMVFPMVYKERQRLVCPETVSPRGAALKRFARATDKGYEERKATVRFR